MEKKKKKKNKVYLHVPLIPHGLQLP